jgi:hypothetical protein
MYNKNKAGSSSSNICKDKGCSSIVKLLRSSKGKSGGTFLATPARLFHSSKGKDGTFLAKLFPRSKGKDGTFPARHFRSSTGKDGAFPDKLFRSSKGKDGIPARLFH